MSRDKLSPSVLAILAAFRDSEDCDGDPSRPMNVRYAWSLGDQAKTCVRKGLAYRRGPITGFEQIQLTDSGLAFFRQAFPDHPYTLDCLASEREATDRRSYLLNIVVHTIEDQSYSPWAVAYRFASEHFDGHTRTVQSVSGDYAGGGWTGIVELAEDDTYKPATYRLTLNTERGIWEFRAPLD